MESWNNETDLIIAVQICFLLLKFPTEWSVLDFAEQCERDKARVLVHCMSGKNR